MRTARIYAAGALLVAAWVVTLDQLARRQPRPLSRRERPSELMDDHLAEWR